MAFGERERCLLRAWMHEKQTDGRDGYQLRIAQNITLPGYTFADKRQLA